MSDKAAVCTDAKAYVPSTSEYCISLIWMVGHYSFLIAVASSSFKLSFLYFILFILFITTLKELEASQITASVFDRKFPPMRHYF